jgi:DNA-binding FrmR family transcriptional regulator
MKSDQRTDILCRLRCAAGHLNAITEMIETDRPCDQVLHQLNAVEGALHAVRAKLIMCQIQSIQAAILKSSSREERLAGLHHLQSLYTTCIKYSDHPSEVIND